MLTPLKLIQAAMERGKQDVLDLHKIVMERFLANNPEGYDLILWGDLKTLMESSEDDEIWKNQQDWKLLSWKLEKNSLKGGTLAKERAEEIRSKPPSKSQLRNLMMTYLKHTCRFTHAQLKSRSFEEIQKLYTKEQKWVDAFVSIGSEEDEKKVGSRKKRAVGSSSKQNSPKKQKVNDQEFVDNDKELRICLKLVLDDDKAINYETLDVKSLIVDCEYQVIGTMEAGDVHVYKLTRLGGSYRHFLTLSRMLKVLDRQDVLDLHKIVMEMFLANNPEGYDLILWGDLKTLMESSEDDEIWKNQQDWKLLSWKLHPWCQETMGGAMAQIRPEGTPIQSNDPPLSTGGHTLGSDEGSMTLKELTDLCTTLSQKVLDLEKVKTAQAKKITSLKKRVTKLKQRKSSRISGFHPFKAGTSRRHSLGRRNVPKQGRKNLKSQKKFQEIDDLVDEGMNFVLDEDADTKEKFNLDADTEVIVKDKGSGEKGGNTVETISTTRLEVSTVELKTPPIIKTLFDDEDVTIANTLVKIKSQKAKEKGVAFKDADDSTRPIRSITTLQPLLTIDSKDKDLDEEIRTKKERQEEASKAVLAKLYDEVEA
nr:hypothetical protein [Tanacetum cinerariifolium]